MRRPHRSDLTAAGGPVLAACAVFAAFLVAAAAFSQGLPHPSPRLVGPTPPMENEQAPPLANPVTDDVRRMRNYPEQPPVIPHSIAGYQLSLRANRCLECHRRQFTEGSGAPMISVTHFMDRDFQVLADVAPRRYFCLQCHVPQTEARPLVDNTFVDMTKTGGSN
jgi:nitrate reductase (cytochrome), electron transfer subunit